MKKINVETMTCFQQVSDVIGKEKAKVELQKAIEGYEEDLENVEVDKELISALYWEATPQGHDFWSDIDSGINPYES
ncbi:hypothetical protein VPHG_00077 [Vibrio phage 11895-B1]|uniref:hypothetical protein n=1 Tax=Vibrio phage 11895-B1 TaxID=754075 RepID=UPI0002C0BB47|nr:hypothetical protein VPHG_00077 [Vibrio phage 11895-B1]AGH32144.1 hypothetical protein VPHG_00077 [Vibrio phage 11895-B1]